jgi:hypothetical protein
VNNMANSGIHTDGIWFKDEHGRTLLLRGVNLGGDSKYPTTPDGRTDLPQGFFQHREVSFVGRPFALDEADEHLRRLATWGLTFVRFLVTWEAIEHTAPDVYDTDYLDYVVAVIQKAGDYGIRVFIDPHQDVWSRFTGGDGAPGWTLEIVGFDMTQFKPTMAALVHQTHGNPFPKMRWATNYNRLATATMFTLFWAGKHYAPNLLIDGVNIQDYLQDHYLKAMQQLAMRLKDLPNVVGYDTMNEPSRGYVGYQNVNAIEYKLKNGATPTPYQAMLLGAGFSQTVDEWSLNFTGNRKSGELPVYPNGATAWLEGHKCVWREHGVWDIDAEGRPHLLQPHYFATINEQPIDFIADILRPFVNRYASAIRAIDPQAIIFFESEALGDSFATQRQAEDAQNVVFAPHWYDGLTLLTKRYVPFLGINNHTLKPVVGIPQVRQSFVEQNKVFKDNVQEKMGGVPVVIGEIGIPYDMNGAIAYRSGDFSAQEQAMDASLSAMDANLLSYTLWNYSASNRNATGDGWNGEDLSIFSRDQQHNCNDIHSGGRALKAVVRPYAQAIAGEPLRMRYDMNSGEFELTFRHARGMTHPTEIFVPSYQYPHGYHVEVSDGEYEIDTANQRLIYRHTERDMPHFVRVLPATPRPEEPKNQLGRMLMIGVVGFVLWRLLRRRK